MIPSELEAQILRLHHGEKWPVGTIASQLGVHHSAVRRVLERNGATQASRVRASKLDSFLPFILETLARYPKLPASRLYHMCRERGYRGSERHFRYVIVRHRPRPPAEAYLRLKTLPGEQIQVDWGHFGKVRIGKAERALMAFVAVLSYSRRIFLRFYLDARGANFLRGHEAAFEDWKGLCRVVLYDNLKSAVLDRRGDAIRFNPRLIAFAKHYRFEPRPVALARGNEKGRVERGIRYVRTSFWPARKWRDLDDLNNQALAWSHGIALERPWPEDRTRTVAEAFEEERSLLLPLPPTPFPTEEQVEVSVRKTPYVRFDGNDYSIPHERTHRTLEIRASLERIRIFDKDQLIAEHARSFDRGQQIEDPAHIAALWEEKRAAHEHRSLDRLARSCPSAQRVFVRLAERGANIGSMTVRFLNLLDQYGAAALEEAMSEALQGEAIHHHAVRQILERRRCEKGQAPILPVGLPSDPHIRDLAVSPHPLSTYDQLTPTQPSEEVRTDESEET